MCKSIDHILVFHVKHICFSLLVLIPLLGEGQAYFKLTDQPFLFKHSPDSSLQQWVTKELKRMKGLNSEEASFFYWVNYVRQHPIDFREEVLAPFLEQFPETKGKESNSLMRDLAVSASRPLLQYNPQLHTAALEQAMDLVSNNGQLSHNSRRGLSFAQRMKVAGITGCASENLYTGKNEPVLALIMLLLDLGLDPPGHRNNILNPGYTSMAVCIRPNRHDNTVVLVQEFGCK